ncbi:hypothetical protein LCGC14_0729550 [marine sediment metagenome]|uniref:Uncharacterized protein n=1 Tax=marine sediment metagenome TaxID=412755 RepID=A0A0F9TH93_9ZZZZ
MTLKERMRNIERLKIQLEILRFKEKGESIQVLPDEVGLRKDVLLQNHFLGESNPEIQAIIYTDPFPDKGVT